MNPLWGLIAGVVVIALMLAFIGIWVWAWNARHKAAFDRLSRLPLEEGRP